MRHGTPDPIGRKFGRWTVLERDLERKGNDIFYLCRCDCGTIRTVSFRNLWSGRSQSCGCYKKIHAEEERKRREQNLLEKRFGMLTVVERTPDGEFRCLCDCGNKITVSAASLKNKSRKSCGCLYSKPKNDLTGRRFGRLTVLGYEGSRNGRTLWRCRCDCGRETIVLRPNLISGATKSCGCLRADTRKELVRQGRSW